MSGARERERERRERERGEREGERGREREDRETRDERRSAVVQVLGLGSLSNLALLEKRERTVEPAGPAADEYTRSC
jgi:hypothetical protein